ncbi:MAG: hypothetical protein ACRER2_10460 [Methylococcales bacterium]
MFADPGQPLLDEGLQGFPVVVVYGQLQSPPSVDQRLAQLAFLMIKQRQVTQTGEIIWRLIDHREVFGDCLVQPMQTKVDKSEPLMGLQDRWIILQGQLIGFGRLEQVFRIPDDVFLLEIVLAAQVMCASEFRVDFERFIEFFSA